MKRTRLTKKHNKFTADAGLQCLPTRAFPILLRIGDQGPIESYSILQALSSLFRLETTLCKPVVEVCTDLLLEIIQLLDVAKSLGLEHGLKNLQKPWKPSASRASSTSITRTPGSSTGCACVLSHIDSCVERHLREARCDLIRPCEIVAQKPSTSDVRCRYGLNDTSTPKPTA